MRVRLSPVVIVMMLTVCAPAQAAGQFLRMRATIPSDSTVLPLVVDVFRAGPNVTITGTAVADTLRARLNTMGYTVGPVQESWGGDLAPRYAHLVIDLWAEGGIRADLTLNCRLPRAPPDERSPSQGYGLLRQSGRAKLTPEVVGDWMARYLPEPSSIGRSACGDVPSH